MQFFWKQALWIGAAAPAITASAGNQPAQDKPNVIFILLDDAGYGDFGYYGQVKNPFPACCGRSGLAFPDCRRTAIQECLQDNFSHHTSKKLQFSELFCYLCIR